MGLIKFLIEDFKSDIKFLVKLFKGELELDVEKFGDLKKGWFDAFTKNWLWFLIILLAFVSGFFWASSYYQNQCNSFIYDNYIQPKLVESANNFSFNFN